MRDLVGKKEFMQFKHIEHELCDLYPDYFKSQYELVTFNTSPYNLALQQGGKNEALIKYIIDNNLESQLSNKEVILPLIKQYT